MSGPQTRVPSGFRDNRRLPAGEAEGLKDSRSEARIQGSVGATLLALGVGAYSVYDSFFLQATPLDIPVYAIVFTWSLLITFLLFATGLAQVRILSVGIAVILVFSSTLIRVPAQDPPIPRYVIGDIAVYSLVGIFVIAAATLWRERIFSKQSHWMVGLSVIASVVAMMGPRVHGRFESPPVVAIGLVAAMILLLGGPKRTIVAGSASVGLLLICLASGNRTSVGLFIVAVAIGLYCRYGTTRFVVFVSLALTAFGMFVGSGIDPLVTTRQLDFVAETRLIQILDSREDASRESRLKEASDVLKQIREGGPAAFTLGFGPGASYQPRQSLITRNLTTAGTVHHIHIGPVMFVYRYGLIGLTAFVLLGILGLRCLTNCRRSPNSLTLGEATILMSMPLYVLELLVFNSTAEPAFAYVVAVSILVVTNSKHPTTQ